LTTRRLVAACFSPLLRSASVDRKMLVRQQRLDLRMVQTRAHGFRKHCAILKPIAVLREHSRVPDRAIGRKATNQRYGMAFFSNPLEDPGAASTPCQRLAISHGNDKGECGPTKARAGPARRSRHPPCGGRKPFAVGNPGTNGAFVPQEVPP
jgi:hypothetical protein